MLQRLFSRAGLSVLFALCVSGATIGGAANAVAQVQPPSAAPTAATYVLGPNDRIRLKVYGEPDIAGEYEIDSNGQVSIPLAGHLTAAGLTKTFFLPDRSPDDVFTARGGAHSPTDLLAAA